MGLSTLKIDAAQLRSNTERFPLNFFAIIPIRSVTYKKGILVGADERGPRPNSDRDGRIYRLAVPVLK